MRRIPPYVWFWLRLAVAAGVMVWLIGSLDWATLRQQVQRIDWVWWTICIAIPLLGVAVSAVKWQGVLRILGVQRPYGELLLRYWSGSFYNNVLPGSVGGDVVRVGGLGRDGVPLTTATLSVLVDRLTGVWVGMLIGLLCCLWPINLPYRETLGLAFGGIVGGGLLSVWGLPRFCRFLPPRFQRYAEFVGLFRQPRFLYTIGLACLFQSLVVLHLWAAMQAFRTPISLLACGIYAQALVVITLLPISLNGIGVREASLVVLLAGNGIAPETVALVGSTIYITTVLSSLPGGLAILKLIAPKYDEAS